MENDSIKRSITNGKYLIGNGMFNTNGGNLNLIFQNSRRDSPFYLTQNGVLVESDLYLTDLGKAVR